MTIATTITAIQALTAAVSGVTRASATYPASLPSAALPAVIVWPGPAEVSLAGAKYNQALRQYRVQVLVDAMQQGRGIDQGWQATIDLMHLMYTKLMASASLILTNAPDQASIVCDEDNPIICSGVQPISYPPGSETFYFGFEFMLPVKESWNGS